MENNESNEFFKNKQRIAEQSAERDKISLKFKVNRVLKTTMIGALAEFEKEFAYLWEAEHKSQEAFINKWEKVRTNILDMGNDNIRDISSEIDDYHVSRIKNNYSSSMRGKGQ